MEQEQSFIAAIRWVREHVVWKPGKGEEHVRRRIQKGHLALNSTLEDYEAIIHRVVTDPTAIVYAYRWGTKEYPSVVADVEGDMWLVMMSTAGVMETAFIVDKPGYLDAPEFVRQGVLGELEV